MARELVDVERDEFVSFVRSYPGKLEADLYMDWVWYNDFTDSSGDEYGKTVAMRSLPERDGKVFYKILKEVKDA